MPAYPEPGAESSDTPTYTNASLETQPVENRPVDDQKRVMSVADAFASGADYIVVGRPIRQAPDPRAKAEEIQQRIAGSGVEGDQPVFQVHDEHRIS